MNDPLRTRPAAAAGSFLALGCAAGYPAARLLAGKSAFLGALLALCLALAILLFVRKLPGAVRLRGVFCVLGLGLTLLALRPLQTAQQEEGWIYGTVAEYPKSSSGQSEVVLDHLSVYDSVSDSWKSLSGRARLYVPDRLGRAEVGDRIFFEGTLKLPRQRRNPGETDRTAVLWSRGIAYRAVAKDGTLQIGKSASTLLSPLYRFRAAMEQQLSNAGEEGKVLRGILFGADDALPDELLETFRTVGAAHVLAVSGLHVSALAGFALWVFRKRRKLGWAVSAVLIAAYGLMAGLTPSVLRAATMTIVGGWGRNHGEKPDVLNLLGAAAIVELTLRPVSVLSLSFQLSYGAVLGIALIGVPWQKWLEEKLRARLESAHARRCRLLTWFGGALSVSLGAQLGVLLPGVQAFGTVPVLGALSNLIIVPLAGVALVSGLLGSAAAVIAGAGTKIASLALLPAKAVVRIMTATARAAESLPYSNVCTGTLSAFGVGAALLFFLTVSLCIQKRGARLAAVVLSAALALTGGTLRALSRNDLTLTMLDVGQGDAICIRQGRFTVLIDGGESGLYGDRGQDVLLPYFRRQGISRIDALVVSHGDRDHCGGLISLCESMEIGRIYIGCEQGDVYFTAFKKAAREKNIPLTLLKTGQSFTAGALTFRTIWPQKAAEGNAGSLVLTLRWKDFSACFTGDIGTEEEEALAQSGRLCAVDVLKVAHHGSKYSTSEAFLDALRPDIALISAGENNPYGHPAKETLRRLGKSGAKTYVTAQRGAIIVTVKPEGAPQVETVLGP